MVNIRISLFFGTDFFCIFSNLGVPNFIRFLSKTLVLITNFSSCFPPLSLTLLTPTNWVLLRFATFVLLWEDNPNELIWGLKSLTMWTRFPQLPNPMVYHIRWHTWRHPLHGNVSPSGNDATAFHSTQSRFIAITTLGKNNTGTEMP